jgi:hypothetical protein
VFLRVDFDDPQEIAAYSINSGPGIVFKRSIQAWELQGWNGSAWVTLDSQAGAPVWALNETRSYTTSVGGRYSAVRLYITAATAGTYVMVGELTLHPFAGGPNIAAAAYSQSVLRTITGLSSPAASYSAANQTSDGLTPGDPVLLRVYQMSAIVGRGIAAEVWV